MSDGTAPTIARALPGLPPRLRGRLAVTFAAVILITCAVAAALLLSKAWRERELIRERTLGTAIALSFGFDQEVAAGNALLKGLSSSPALKANDAKGFYDQLKATPIPDNSWLILQDLDGQVKQLQDQQQKLVANEKQLETRIEQFRSQKEVIKAQYSAAEAQVRINEAATGIGREMDNTGLAIQRAKDRTEEMQARASALDELVSSGDLQELGSDKTQLDRELQQLASQQQVDRELEALKAEVGSGAPQKELEESQQEQSPGA